MSDPSVRYQLSQHIHGVRLEDHPGSSLRNPTSQLVEIPAGATVELEGAVSSSGLVTVIWNGGVYSVFYDDLKDQAKSVAG